MGAALVFLTYLASVPKPYLGGCCTVGTVSPGYLDTMFLGWAGSVVLPRYNSAIGAFSASCKHAFGVNHAQPRNSPATRQGVLQLNRARCTAERDIGCTAKEMAMCTAVEDSEVHRREGGEMYCSGAW